jgi:hypothetical protein
VQSSKLYHLGFRSSIARNTLANANATRDLRIYCDFAQSLIGTTRRLYADEALGLDLRDTVYALDATTIDLCLSVFPWAPFQSGGQAAHALGFAGQYPVLHLHQRRQAPPDSINSLEQARNGMLMLNRTIIFPRDLQCQ